MITRVYILLLFTIVGFYNGHYVSGQRDGLIGNGSGCPPQELILPCRCSQRGEEIQIWCSHSDLPRVLNGMKSVSKTILRPVDELILENNFLPSLPGRSFSPLQIVRLMLRHNGLERLSNGWLNDLDDSLVEVFIVERDLRGVPVDSLSGLKKLEAVTIQSEVLKRTPDFSGLPRLRYINIQSPSLLELIPLGFRKLINLETVHITGSPRLSRLEAGLFRDLHKMHLLNVADNGINWIHLRALSELPSLKTIILSGNQISDAGMVGRAIKDITNLEILKLDHNHINILGEGSFVDLPSLKELYLNDNSITEIHHGAFHRTPNLKVVHLENNYLRRVHPESFLQASGSGVEILHLHHNDVGRIEELRSLLDALPSLRFLDLSYNKLEEIPFGALRGHGTLEQLYLDHNLIRMIERDAFMAMPGLRELRLKNNSVSDLLHAPFWNLPGLKGLDLSENRIRRIDATMLMGIPSLRRIDLSGNNLNFIDPSTFTNTPMLETLNMSYNELGQIHPATFRNLEGLFEIDASQNMLPEMIQGLPRAVERVIIKNNHITNISPGKTFELPNLRTLDMSGNMIQRLPRSTFKALGNLRTLKLARNKIQAIDEGSLLGLIRLENLNVQDNNIMVLHERSLNQLNSLRNFNVQGNRLELLGDRLFENVPQLERLDLSRNNLIEIFPNSFRQVRSLQSLDLSSNNMKELPESLLGLSELKDMDVSFNSITNLSPDILASFRKLEELRASNNKVTQLHQGHFRNMPLLQYLDLSSNELAILEPGSVRNLPELQEMVLADNKLVDIQDRVFEDLPNLQAVHLQQNYLRSISPHSFFRSPSIVYLNLSSNQFRYMDHVGLRSVRSLEVLDLSNNGIRKISTSPLRGLDWLVELKLDDNRICKVQGEPFASMPRLRVLSMRNNRMSTLPETPFQTLRGNIAVLDLDGNPLECSCDILWLRAWLEAESNNPGPRCRDGTMLREARITRNDCQFDSRNNQIPLTNEHGDLFIRRADFDDCESENLEELQSQLPPSPEESEYFYDQFIDFPLNDTHLSINGTPLNNLPHRPPPLPPNYNANTTLLNLSRFPPRPPPPSSPFTFFGVPLPTLSLNNLWNGGGGVGRDIKNRANVIPGTRGKGRVQIYRPGEADVLKFIEEHGRYPDAEHRVRNSHLNVGEIERYNLTQPSDNTLQYNRPYFQTPFNNKAQYEKGFTPMVPGTLGGFTPINDPYANATNSTTNSNDWPEPDDFKEVVPLITDNPLKRENSREETTTSVAAPLRPNDLEEKFPENSNRLDYVTHPTIPTTEMTTPLPPSSSTPTTTQQTTKSTTLSTTTTSTTLEPPTVPVSSTTTTTTSTTQSPFYSDFPEDLLSSEESNPKEPELDEEEPQFPDAFEEFYSSTTEKSTTNYKKPSVWENINHSPSSLSALVAPGAQQNIYRIPQSGRPTITKVVSPPPPNLPTAEEYLRTTKNIKYSEFDDNDDQVHESEHDYPSVNSVTTTIIDKNEPKKREDMEWYFANYNKTMDESRDFDPGINRHKSDASCIATKAYKILVFLGVIHMLILN